MSEDDYEGILDDNVDEVKKQIRELEDPEYERLLELEKDGKDRKTVKDFLQEKIDSQDVEVEEVIDPEDGEGVDTRYAFLVAGAVIGLVIGAAVVAFGPVSQVNATAPAEQVQSDVQQLQEANAERAGFEGNISVSEPAVENQMYVMDIEIVGNANNRTVNQTQTVYVTMDGELMFRELQRFGQVISPRNLQDSLEEAQSQQQQPEEQLEDSNQTGE